MDGRSLFLFNIGKRTKACLVNLYFNGFFSSTLKTRLFLASRAW